MSLERLVSDFEQIWLTQGWSKHKMILVLLEYIAAQDMDGRFLAFIQNIADEENSEN